MTSKIAAALAAAGMAFLGGCATVIEGMSQDVSVTTDPPGASCVVERQGEQIAVLRSPSVVTVPKSKYDLTITCEKKGYGRAQYVNHPGVTGTIVADLIFSAGILALVDSSTGADNKYRSPVNLTLDSHAMHPQAQYLSPQGPGLPQAQTLAPAAPR